MFLTLTLKQVSVHKCLCMYCMHTLAQHLRVRLPTSLLPPSSMTTSAATHAESQILERKHTMKTATAADDETEILEQQRETRGTGTAKDVAEVLELKYAATMAPITNEETEILEQHTAVTAWKKRSIAKAKSS